MRIVLAALTVGSVFTLAACGSEEATQNAFRQASIAGCVSSSRSQPTPAALANFDWDRLCACATDRIMEGKSAAELAQLQPDGPGQREAVQQCVVEMMSGAPAAPAGNQASE